ncbi:leucine-rich repeat-containing protein [Candidatus Magnetomorum sp. HK-1]|nr:leucine-rich repeat-containing protein [Candidatus Magnetomorum sp. HK-1]
MKVKKAELQSLKKIQQMIGGKLEEENVIFNDERSVVGLNLYNKQITDLSPLKESKILTHIYLRINQITDLSPLKELKNLTHIDLTSNQITDLSPLKELKNLTHIELSSNQISDLSPLKELKNLTQINLIDNNIKKLPKEILDLNLKVKWSRAIYSSNGDRVPGIFLFDNPLENPPIEVIKQGNKAIKTYFESLEEKENPLNEIKVLLVGDGGAGKTSLIKKLLGSKFDPHESKTDGIAIRDWPISIDGKEINVHFWDFGGQEIMHSTHQFFLSKRSLYILVLDDRKEENEEYWLKMIECFGGTSPILIALNKMDENPSFDVNRKSLRNKYKGIKDFALISCKTNQGIDVLIEQLKQHILDVEIIQTTWPEKWFKVKQELEKMKKNYISFDDFQHICQQHDIKDSSHQDVLLEFLHDLGVVVHFSDIELFDTSVLNPEWVTHAVYKIINSDQMAETKGLLYLDDLSQILTEAICPRHKHQFIVSLMEKFELCYKIDSKAALLPDLLGKQEPEFDFNEDASLQFILDYDFMPKSIMPQFIVKMHHDIQNKSLQWRTGVVLANESFGATAVIKADMKDEKVYIYITGKQKRDYLAIIRDTFNKVHEKFEKIIITELIPLPWFENFTVEYIELIGHEMENKKEIFVGKIRQTFDVQFLLNRIESKKAALKKIRSMTDFMK